MHTAISRPTAISRLIAAPRDSRLFARTARSLFLFGVGLICIGATAKEVELTGPQIRAAISGKYVTDEHHWGHRYFADGRVERSEGRRKQIGRWSVKGNRLCLLRQEISRNEPLCYLVVRDGDELQYRDDHSVAYRGLIRPMPKGE